MCVSMAFSPAPLLDLDTTIEALLLVKTAFQSLLITLSKYKYFNKFSSFQFFFFQVTKIKIIKYISQ